MNKRLCVVEERILELEHGMGNADDIVYRANKLLYRGVACLILVFLLSASSLPYHNSCSSFW